jgi:hypothetical protein
MKKYIVKKGVNKDKLLTFPQGKDYAVLSDPYDYSYQTISLAEAFKL